MIQTQSSDPAPGCSCAEAVKARGACGCGQGPVIRRAIRPSSARRPASASEQRADDIQERLDDKFETPDGRGTRPRQGSSNDPTLPRWDCGTAPGEAVGPGGSWVTTGDTLLDTADADRLDVVISLFMAVNNIPSGAFAVVSGDGRLVHARGFTNPAAYALAGEPTFVATPDSKFRIGGVSQLVTAIATLQLDQAGLLPSGIESLVQDFVALDATPPWPLSVHEPRGADLTLKHLLTHTGGWFEGTPKPDRAGIWVDGVADSGIHWNDATSPRIRTVATSAGPDATRQYTDITAAFDTTLPVTQDQVLWYGNTRLMTFDPGTRYKQSDYGYWLLGRVIEGATCRGYDAFVRDRIWRALGAWNKGVGAWNSVIGDTGRTGRAVNEVPYYVEAWPHDPAGYTSSVMQTSPYEATATDYEPYAAFDVRCFDAHGGWLSSAYDLALLLRDIFVGPSVLLSRLRVEWLLLYPWVSADPADPDVMACLGLETNGKRFWKEGRLPGSIARVENLGNWGDNASFVYLFNRNWGGLEANGSEEGMAESIRDRLRHLTTWGTGDLFVP